MPLLTSCDLSEYSPCEIIFDSIQEDEQGETIYVSVCHSHQTGLKSYSPPEHTNEFFDDMLDPYEEGFYRTAAGLRMMALVR